MDRAVEARLVGGLQVSAAKQIVVAGRLTAGVELPAVVDAAFKPGIIFGRHASFGPIPYIATEIRVAVRPHVAIHDSHRDVDDNGAGWKDCVGLKRAALTDGERTKRVNGEGRVDSL